MIETTDTPSCFVCGTVTGVAAKDLEAKRADGSDPRAVRLGTCAECRAKLRRARDQRAVGLSGHGRRARVWYAIDLFFGFLVLGAGFFIAGSQDWIPAWLVWGGWAYVALALPAALALYAFNTWWAKSAPARWAASNEKKAYDALAAEARTKLDDRVHTATTTDHRVEMDDPTLLDPRTWKPE